MLQGLVTAFDRLRASLDEGVVGLFERTRSAGLQLRHSYDRRGPRWLVMQLALSALAAWIFWVIASSALSWAFQEARWEAVAANLRLFAVGPYPRELLWRPMAALLLVTGLIGVSAAIWGSILRDFALLLAGLLVTTLILPLLAPLLAESPQLALLAAAFGAGRRLAISGLAVLMVAYFLGQQAPRSFGADRLQLLLRVSWLLSIPAVALILDSSGSGASARMTEGWGGLLLTLVLAAGSIALSFPLGVLLALGRRSRLPLVKLVCVSFIELVRGVPLVTLLYMAGLLLPLIVPSEIRPGDVLRAMAGLTCFAAAYVAEDVRGGLASVGTGQFESAKALGLGTVATYRLIILPQALRAVIPAIVGQFISLFKDTSLAIIIGLRELLGVARIVSSQSEYIGLYRETLSFIAIIFFVFSFAMSRASRRLERQLGLGER